MTPLDVEKVAEGLTEAQREAMIHPNAGGSSYTWAKFGTLRALMRRGLIDYRPGVGSFYSPQTAIKWPLTPLGLAVRQHLLNPSKERSG